MTPTFALALLAIAGLLGARLPRFSTPRSLALIRDGHVPLVLLGALVGPVIGALDRPTLRALAPVTALAVGWWGAQCGARLERRLLARLPRPLWTALLAQSAAVFAGVAGGAWLLARFVRALGAVWQPGLPVALTLGAVAVTASAGRAGPGRRGPARLAPLATACGAAAAVTALAPLHPHAPFGAGVFGVIAWLAFGAASGVAIGLAFAALTPSAAERRDLPLALLALLTLGAGVGYATGVSPFLVCAVAAAVMVNTSRAPHAVRTLLASGSRLADAVLFIAAGALLAIPTWWIVPGAVTLAAIRLAATLAVARRMPPALVTVAQDGSAVALGLNFVLCAGGSLSSSGAVATTVVLAAALSQAAAHPLARLARLTQGAARAELRGSSSPD